MYCVWPNETGLPAIKQSNPKQPKKGPSEMNIHDNDENTQDAMILAEGRIHRLRNKLGQNGPYGADVDQFEFDCSYMQGHSKLFRNPQNFQADIETAVETMLNYVQMVNTEIHQSAKKRVIATTAIMALSACFRYLQEAAVISEVLTIKAPIGAQSLFSGRTLAQMNVEQQTSNEPVDNSRFTVSLLSVADLLLLDDADLRDNENASKLALEASTKNLARIKQIRKLQAI